MAMLELLKKLQIDHLLHNKLHSARVSFTVCNNGHYQRDRMADRFTLTSGMDRRASRPASFRMV